MLRTFRPARRKSAKSFASALAMAIALTGGAALTTGMAPTMVVAQEYSDDFVEIYQPVADVVNAEGDIASVSGQFDVMQAMELNDDEKNALGNLILTAGNNTSNPPWQRRGLELQLESGKLPPEAIPQYQWYVGNIAFNMEDFDASRAALMAAREAGWAQDDPVSLIAETYYQQEDISSGVRFVALEADSLIAAGGEVPAQWLLRGLVAAYEYDLLPEATTMSLLLVENHPSETHWMNALQVINALSDVDESVQLDVLRLMRATNSLSNGQEYVRYIAAADPRIMSNELDGLVADALREGYFEADDPYYQEIRGTIDTRMAGDREDAPSMVAEAEADATGESAMLAGDVLMSLSDWAGAEAMYVMAAEKGGVDTNLANLRAGMMQARQGKTAEAVASLAQVTGPRELPAKFWAAYAQSM